MGLEFHLKSRIAKSLASFPGRSCKWSNTGGRTAWERCYQILAFQCGREFLTYNTEFNACHDKSIRILFDLFCVFIDGGVRVCAGPWRGSNFQLVRGPQKLSFRVFSSRRSSLNFCFKLCRLWSCPFIHIHAVWRLPYPEIPTLIKYGKLWELETYIKYSLSVWQPFLLHSFLYS